MNLKELHELTGKLLAQGVNPELPVGNSDHYGELEDEVLDLEVCIKERYNNKNRRKPYINLVGMPSKYDGLD